MHDAIAKLWSAIVSCFGATHLRRALAAMMLLAVTPAAAQWTTESPLPTHLEIRGIAAPAAGRVFLATDDDWYDDGGALFESGDGGAIWTQRAVPESLGGGLFGVFFFDDQLGWVWGNENYRTTDGGTTWEPLPLLGSAYFMEFESPSFGVTTGNFGAFVSRDGGLSWDPSPQEMSEFSFSGESIGLGAAATGLFRSTDGGVSFGLVHEGAAEAVAYLAPSVAVAIVDGSLLRSTDGGQSWTDRGSAAGRSELFVVSADVVVAWGRSGDYPDFDDRLLRSADGGASWADLGEPIDQSPFAAPLAFAAPSPANVIVSDGAGNLYRSTDAGLSWALAFASPGPAIGFFSSAAPAFVDGETGYFGFGAGFVIRTTDGGASWSQISSGSGTAVLALESFPNGDLLAVGEAGQVLTRASGAASWQIRSFLGAANLEAVQRIGPQEVVAVDGTGVVHRSTDAGGSWSAAATAPVGLTAADLYFKSALEGWVVGQGFEGAALFHTEDAGGTWTPVTDFQGTYVAVDFAGASGWAAAVYGTFYRTTDDGLTWTAHELPGSAPAILDMDFWSPGVGYAVGDSGYAARTSDGGLSWQMLPTPSADDRLTDIELVGPDELWVSTAAGKLLHTATGGQNWSVMDSGSTSFWSISALVATPAEGAWIAGGRGLIRRFAGPPPPPVNQPPVAAFSFVTTGLSVALHGRQLRQRRRDFRLAVGFRRRHDVNRPESHPSLCRGRKLFCHPHGDRRRRGLRQRGSTDRGPVRPGRDLRRLHRSHATGSALRHATGRGLLGNGGGSRRLRSRRRSRHRGARLLRGLQRKRSGPPGPAEERRARERRGVELLLH